MSSSPTSKVNLANLSAISNLNNELNSFVEDGNGMKLFMILSVDILLSVF